MTLALRGNQRKPSARCILHLLFPVARDLKPAAAAWSFKRKGRQNQRSSRPQNVLDLLEISLLLAGVSQEVEG